MILPSPACLSQGQKKKRKLVEQYRVLPTLTFGEVQVYTVFEQDVYIGIINGRVKDLQHWFCYTEQQSPGGTEGVTAMHQIMLLPSFSGPTEAHGKITSHCTKLHFVK